MTTLTKTLDTERLSTQVQKMYTMVALFPEDKYHFEMGKALAIKLGYPEKMLNQLPPEAIESFAGVGYYFDMMDINPGDKIVDLGSGSGMDAFLASYYTGPYGKVTGIDMTSAQLRKSAQLARQYGFNHVEFRKGRIEGLDIDTDSINHVISNGVINLSPEKELVFKEVYRILRKGGSLTFSDIITEKQMPESITCNSDLWAACIGGATQIDELISMISASGLVVVDKQENPQYGFISSSAQGATSKYGVKSISIKAIKI